MDSRSHLGDWILHLILPPVCMHVRGGSWWVCACTVGLLSITGFSGYTTWSVISQLLNGTSSYNSYFSRFLSFEVEEKKEVLDHSNYNELNSDECSSTFLEKEISITAQAFHSHLVLPWYSYISPDDKYSLQIRSTLEDLLTGIFKNLKQHTKLSVLCQHILTLYVQHYRQFYKALKKVSQKLKKRPIECISHVKEIREFYKPLHSGFKTTNGTHLHFQRLAHLLLINYLPVEITRCNLLFICLKDIFAQNILQSSLDLFCDIEWLNETLTSALEQNSESGSKHTNEEEEYSSDGVEIENGTTDGRDEKVWSYTHSLSSIREETSFEVLDVDLPFGEEYYTHSLKHSNGLLKKNSCGRKGSVAPQQGLNLHGSNLLTYNEKKIENTRALLKYLQQSSSIEKDTKDKSKLSVATALGDLISTTTVPVLHEDITFPSAPSKMWESPMEEEVKSVVSLKKKNPFRRIVVEGLTEHDYKEKLMKNEKHLLYPCLETEKIDSNKLNCGEFLSELHRSKSLNSLNSDTNKKPMDNQVSETEFHYPDSSVRRIWHSADSLGTRDGDLKSSAKKSKWALRKMNSFDKNDGTDDYSVACVEFNPEIGSSTDSSITAPITDEEKTALMENKEGLKSISFAPSASSSSASSVIIEEDPKRTSLNSLELPLSPSVESIREFGWENPDLSPIYEESENLASTIAKLRCLLSERQSQHSLGSQSSFGSSESEPKSAQSDPGRYTSSVERSRFTFFHKDSSGSLASVKSSSSSDSSSQWYCSTNEEEPLEASEIPIDGKVFVNISIPTTEVRSESAGFQYTVYIIQYDAIYLCETLPVPGEEGGTTEPSQAPDQKMVLQTNFVRRRFREFLSLHSALEEDPALRTYMKGVKGPNKWLNLPFSKLDSATISSRKLFLEKYLQALIQRPAINTSIPLKDFLAYGSDASISFMKKPLELNVPRLDKLLARTVSGVFHSIKTALPNFDSMETPLQSMATSGTSSSLASRSTKGTSLTSSDGLNLKGGLAERDQQTGLMTFNLGDFDVQLDITAEEQVCEMEGTLLSAITSTSELNSPVENASEAQDLSSESAKQASLGGQPVSFHPKTYDTDAPYQSLQSCQRPLGDGPSQYTYNPNPLASFWTEIGVSPSRLYPLRRQESQESLGAGESDGEDNHPLFLALVDALVEVVSSTDHPITRQGATILITRLWAQPITNFLQSKLERIFSEDLFQAFFSRVRSCIANASAQSQTSKPISREYGEYLSRVEASKDRLKLVLKEFIPNVLEIVLGSESTNESLVLFVESIQHSSLNKDLGLHLIDLIFVHLLLPV